MRGRSKENIKNFLKCDLDKLRVAEITDGEITLEFDGEAVTLYLNHELNEDQGFPKSFKITKVTRGTL